MKSVWSLVIAISSLSFSFGADLRTDLPDLFEKYYVITERDFHLDFQNDGQAEYEVRNVFGSDFLLKMSEELTVYDTKANDEIEMCNGTVIDLNSGQEGGKKSTSFTLSLCISCPVHIRYHLRINRQDQLDFSRSVCHRRHHVLR